MLKAGTETGSVINHIYSRVVGTTPEVGMGATILCWTDRHAGTIIRVTRTQVHVQEDNATRTDSNGMSENQDYAYEADPQGKVHVFQTTKKGYRNRAGNGLLIGTREKYHDYSF
jgi:hypothetical protein